MILSNASLQLDRNNYWLAGGDAGKFEYGGASFTSFAAYQSESKQDSHSRLATVQARTTQPARGKLDRALVGDAAGSPTLISLLDDSADAHSQLVFLRSMNEQYASQGLKVRIVGTPAPNWRLDGIPVRQRAMKRHAMVETFLVNADGVVVEHWHGFTPAQNLGIAIQKLLGTWRFGDDSTPNSNKTN